jgi:hypothetical protein
MLTTLFYVLLYIAIIIGVCIWDAFIGLEDNTVWNGQENPPLSLVAVLWPIAIPLFLIGKMDRVLDNVRKKRLEKEKKHKEQKERLRTELLNAVDELEKEINKEYKEKVFLK